MEGETWSEVELGELIDVKHGFAFKGEYFKGEPPGDILLTPGNFAIGGGFKYDKLKYYDGPVPEDYVLDEGDLLVTMTDLSKAADTLGYPALVPARDRQEPRYLHNQRLGLVTIKEPDRLRKRFLYYLMCTRDYRHDVVAGATGTTVKHTSPTKIKCFRGRIPPPREQDIIADILGSLDDKIELNRRTNRVLEGMVRAIFEAWFINFEPVKAKVAGAVEFAGMPQEVFKKLPDQWAETKLGPVPKGWNQGTLGAVMEHPRRPADPHSMDPLTPYIGLEHIPKKSLALWDWGTAGNVTSNKHQFERGELLFGKLRPYFHKVSIAPIDGVCSTDVVVVRPHAREWFGFVLGHISSDAFVAYTSAASTGTKMPRTNWKDMSQFAVALPPTDLASTFSTMMEPNAQRIVAAVHESRVLAALRNALLPRLTSGELRVSRDEGVNDGG